MTTGLWVVLPGGIDDPAAPSGGNSYDRAVCDRLAHSWDVHEIAVGGTWPRPAPASAAAVASALAGVPDGAPVLLDGLVACGIPAVLEAEAARLRLIVLVHLPLGDEGPDAADLVALERRALHAAAAVVATSAGAARRLTELHDLPTVEVAPPGVDLAPVGVFDEAGRRLLCVAAISHRKGQDILVAALDKLDDLDWSCTCVGAGTPLPSSRARFAGPRVGAELDATYAAADLLVLPSRAETYGMVVTEALARGIPVIGTQVNGVPEALGAAPGGTVPGVLVPPGDPDALAGALRGWLTDGDLRARWRAAAVARRATLRDWDHTTRLLDEVLHA